MKYLKYIFIAAAFTTTFAGCDMSDFGDINESPNSPTKGYNTMLFTRACEYVPNFIMNSATYDPWTQEYPGYVAEAKNNQFGALQTTYTFTFGGYFLGPIRNLNLIISQCEGDATKNTLAATSFGDTNNQIAAAKTLRAFLYMTMTDIVGPMPYSEAFQGESLNNWLPAFDSQESIYKALDADLQSAFKQFNTASNLTDDDVIYGGNTAKWKKFNAVLRMMMAIKMADVDPTNGKARFAQAYADGGFASNGDSFNWTYDTNSNCTFYTIGNKGYTARGLGYGPNEVIVNMLKEYKDNRLLKYFELNGYLGDHSQGVDQSKLSYGVSDAMDAQINSLFLGIPFGLASNNDVTAAAAKACSVAQDPYCQMTATYGVITYSRMLLVEAEAAEYGWISADPKALYEAGVKASFAERGATGADAYLATAKVALSSDKTTAIKQIVTQRYLGGFLNDGIEIWSDWRRFNIPVIPINVEPAKYDIKVYPYRMSYGDNDVLYDKDAADKAIQTYLGGKDSRWSRVWWDTKDNI